ncbi:MAG: haloacid dehalogenase type II [Phycisphaerales bacterium JB039]
MLDVASFDAMTFDCYGTLIDWETGIVEAVQPVLRAHDVSIDDDSLLELYAELESGAQQGEFRPYREILGSVMDGFGARLGFAPTGAERDVIAASVADWAPFDDTTEALGVLGRHCRLAILSNIDDDLIAGSLAQLGVEFAAVVTAEQVKSYKPRRAHFDEGLRRLGLDRSQALHVAQSRYHDIAPAGELGFATVWVNRQAGRHGATTPSVARPDLEVPSLGALARLAERQ